MVGGTEGVFDTLLIGASFFGYASEIKAELERRGRRVIWYEDRPSLDTASKALLRMVPTLMRASVREYCYRVIREVRKFPIRDVLIIKGEAFGPDTIQSLRRALPLARISLYFWDSYRNMPADSMCKVGICDNAFTFDLRDAAADPRLRYRPLFYLPEYISLSAACQDIDLLFVGTSHSDRYAVLRRLARSIPPGLRFERVLFMSSRRLLQARRVLSPSYWSSSPEEFTFVPLTKPEVLALISRARIIIDIERPIQSGYTMRTIETFGASRKLITTNPFIAEADFYVPDNQVFIDRGAPVIEDAFLHSSWNPAKAALLPRYSLRGWVDEVLSD